MHDQIPFAGKNTWQGRAQGHKMTAISSHSGKKDVRIHLGSLPYSLESYQPTTKVSRSGIGYAGKPLNATGYAANPA
jgi:hypothetical protein